MRRFKFKLQTSLDLARKREDLLKQEFYLEQKRFNQETARLKELKERFRLLTSELRGAVQGRLNLDKIKLYQNFIPALTKHIDAQTQLVETARRNMETARQALLKVMREKKMLEKLRQRHLVAYQQDVLREEQNAADELATTGFYRQNIGT